MRKLKFSFALVVALLAVGVAVATNAKHIGSRVVTACFEQVQLINQFGATITLPLAAPANACGATEAAMVNNGINVDAYLWLNAVPSTQRTNCQPSLTTFCCLEFDVDGSAPAIVPNVIPQTGYASAKYKVLFDALSTPLVRCRN